MYEAVHPDGYQFSSHLRCCWHLVNLNRKVSRFYLISELQILKHARYESYFEICFSKKK